MSKTKSTTPAAADLHEARRKRWASAFAELLGLLRDIARNEREDLTELGIATIALRGSARNYAETPSPENSFTLEHAAIYYAEQLALVRGRS
jgi:hypothetical protein